MSDVPKNTKAKCRAGHTFVTQEGTPGKCWCGEVRAPVAVDADVEVPPRLRFTIICEAEITSLEHWNATSLEDAVEHQRAWIDDGTHSIEDIVLTADLVDVTVEGIPGDG